MSKYYTVVQIISKTSLIIDYGLINGAKKGDKLRIVAIGDSIIHPIENMDIGTIDTIKETVQVVIPYEEFSICQHIIIKSVASLTSATIASSIMNMTEIKDLNVDENDIKPISQIEAGVIRVGDSVFLVESK